MALRVASLWRYPVKSLAGEQISNAVLSPDGIPGDRIARVRGPEGVRTSRRQYRLIGLRGTLDAGGRPLINGHRWDGPEAIALVKEAAGRDAWLEAWEGVDRFDILPLLVATDGAIAAFGRDRRRLRPNIVLGGVPGLAERAWEGRQVAIGDVVIALADLRGRCIVTTYDPDTVDQDVGVLLGIRAQFGGTLALNAWAGRSGRIAVGDAAELLDAERPVDVPLVGRFA